MPPKVITTGAAVASASGLTLACQDAVSDIFSWLHLTTSHPQSWAVLGIAAVGFVIHHACDCVAPPKPNTTTTV